MPHDVGKYVVYQSLGKGKYSTYRYAVDRRTRLAFAIKIIDKMKIERDGLLEKMTSEIAILKMIDCDKCINVKDMIVAPRHIFVIVDLMIGGSLERKIKRHGRLSEDGCRQYFHQIVQGLRYCHSMEIVFVGLKLTTILLNGDGNIKLTDFGLATLDLGPRIDPEASTSRSDTVYSRGHFTAIEDIMSRRYYFEKSSPHYLAPEVLEDNCLDAKASDVYVLGIDLFAMALGALPFDDQMSTAEILHDMKNMPQREFNHSLSSGMKSLIHGILSPCVEKRWTLDTIQRHPWMHPGRMSESVLSLESERVPPPKFNDCSETISTKVGVFSVLCNPMQLCDERFDADASAASTEVEGCTTPKTAR